MLRQNELINLVKMMIKRYTKAEEVTSDLSDSTDDLTDAIEDNTDSVDDQVHRDSIWSC